MPSPLNHDDLISSKNLQISTYLSFDMAEMLCDVKDLPRMTAIAVLLISACQEAGEDPQDVLEQILDTAELGLAKQKGLN